MKIKKQDTTRKSLIVTTVVIFFLLIGGVLLYLYVNNGNLNLFSDNRDESTSSVDDEGDVNLDEPTSDQVSAGTETKSNSLKNNPDNDITVKNDDAIGIDVTAVKTQDSDMIHIQTRIKKLTTTGACTLTLTKGDVSKKYPEVGVQALSDYSTCKGFKIDSSSLSPGTWSIDVEFKDSTSRGNATTTIQV
tara:strand:- start:356 stop:925 length:570 start_codon:yes stop_codon:yes gene_type:complete